MMSIIFNERKLSNCRNMARAHPLCLPSGAWLKRPIEIDKEERKGYNLMERILVVEDDKHISRLLKYNLENPAMTLLLWPAARTL